MTFLNWAMLAALAAVAIPILIHLLNRQKATVVDWGAMRFLLESLTSRSRRILIEEIILMALRCLAVALLVLALARPFMPSRSNVPWALVLPMILMAAISAGIAAAVWSSKRTRWILLGVGAVLFVGALSASGIEFWLQGKQWSLSGGERDVVILIDGSTSMTIPVDGQTNFQRAVEEARAVVEACRPADAISILVAGPVPRPVIANPITDRQDIEDALRRVAPTGGTMRVIDSLVAAGSSLAQGSNPAKKIVVITDGQSLGWDPRNEARWQFLAAGLKELPIPPQIVCRTLPLPKTLRNAAVGDIRFSRQVVGTDRPVRIDVALLNTGSTSIEPQSVELLVDGVSVARQDAGEMTAGAAETVRFDHQFEQPGLHVIKAKVLSDDQIPGDNETARVIDVVDSLPVLVVEGDPSDRPLDGAASFLTIALTPGDEDATDATTPAPAPAAAPKKAAVKDKDKEASPTTPEDKLGRLVTLTTVGAPDIQSVSDFHPYRLVVLANVPKLPQATMASLRRFVQDGGGLLIVTGDKVLPSFYNTWMTDGGGLFVPALLGKRLSLADSPAHLAQKTFSHPALQLLAEATQSDADRAIITAYWGLQVDQKDVNIRIAGLFDTGDPAVVERKVGKGYVLMTAVALDRRESNLPSLKCYVPLVHELAYYLASPALAQTNVRPGSEFVLEMPAKSAEIAKRNADRTKQGPVPGPGAEVVTPTQQRISANTSITPAGLRVTFAGTYEPGLYHLVLSKTAADDYTARPAAKEGLPFVVLNDADEGRMTSLTESEFDAIGSQVNFFHAANTTEMVAAVADNVPGEEMWKYLAIALLVALLAEIGLTRWIATQRRMHSVETVAFGPAIVDVQTFRERAKALVSVSNRPSGSASKA